LSRRPAALVLAATTAVGLVGCSCDSGGPDASADGGDDGGLRDAGGDGGDGDAGDLLGAAVPAGPFAGTALLGNGRLVAVWNEADDSADPPGLAHLYLGDFGLDLVEGGRTRVVEPSGATPRPARVGLAPFFAPFAETPLADGGSETHWALVIEDDAVVVTGLLSGGAAGTIVPHVTLRAEPDMDGGAGPWVVTLDADRRALVAELAGGTTVALGARPLPASWQAGTFDASGVGAVLSGRLEAGRDLALALPLEGAAGAEQAFTWALAAGTDRARALATLDAALGREDRLADAALRASAFAPAPDCAEPAPCAVAAANLWAAHVSVLGGDVPADLTGQFVTNGRPQLYPRDAFMVARALGAAGHADEAWDIVRRWLDADRDRPAPGEWFARYDARGRAVDAGSGAAYDVPEWDAQGYLAVLVEQLDPARASPAQRDAVLDALDALVLRQDAQGLFTEGGIVEWVGRLPATAMIAWAGLDAGARLADAWGDVRSASYRAAAGRLRGGLLALRDGGRGILADERDGGFGWDSSLVFGPLWGFPLGPPVLRTLDWLLVEAGGLGGVRYFEGNEYGGDVFFFTTSGAAELLAIEGRPDHAAPLVDWMLTSTNRYGLAPERVYLSGAGASPASPLSWCAAELGQAIRVTADATVGAPPLALDGDVSAAEMLPRGRAVIDADGAPDGPGDPVALYAAVDGEDLVLAVSLAGPTDALAGAGYRFWLSGAEGTGPTAATDGGARLSFRAEPGAVPGAAAHVDVTIGPGACTRATEAGAPAPCDDFAVGAYAFEARIALADLGLSAPVQVVLATDAGGGGEALLPPHGALATAEDDTVLVGFEVDATAVADRLDPDRGVVVTLSGDRPELGAWAGDAVALADDGTGLDAVAADGLWTTVVRTTRGGTIEYKYLVGVPGDGSWAGVEMEGANRALAVTDLDGSGRMRVRETFGARDAALLDP